MPACQRRLDCETQGEVLASRSSPANASSFAGPTSRSVLTGATMKFITLCNYTGFVQCEIFAEAYRRWRLATVRWPVVEVEVTVAAFDNGERVHTGRAASRKTACLPPHPKPSLNCDRPRGRDGCSSSVGPRNWP